MKINGIEKLSLVDFDNAVACTLFTCGCNFRCPFCHNAPLVVGNAPDEIPEDEIFDYLTKRKNLLDGVVITGGEPTLHADLPEFIQKIKAIGYKVKLDTNGTNPKMLKRLIDEKLVDYVAMDIKNCKEKYALTAGVTALDISAVNESVSLLLSGGVDYEFRTTLVGGYHTQADMLKIGEWISGAKKYALQKYTERETCLTQGNQEITKEKALEFKDLLKKYLRNIALRGY